MHEQRMRSSPIFIPFKIVDLPDIIIIAFLIYQPLGTTNCTRALGSWATRRWSWSLSGSQHPEYAHCYMAAQLAATSWVCSPLRCCSSRRSVRALERMGQTDQWASKLFNGKALQRPQSLARVRGAAPSLPSAMQPSAFSGDQDRRPYRTGAPHQPFPRSCAPAPR